MSSTKDRWVIARPAKIVSDPYFSKLIGHQRGADQKRITTSQNEIFGASCAPHNHDGISSNSRLKRGSDVDSKLNGKSNLTEWGQQRQKTRSETTSVTNNEHVEDGNRKYAEHERYNGIIQEPC